MTKSDNVMAAESSKQVSQVSASERGTLVTTCCIINALKSALPPAMIFPRVHVNQRMTAEAPAVTLGLATPTDWMTAELFSELMLHFIKYLNASKANPALLVFDNHRSHLTIPVIDLAKDNRVHMFTLHQHRSHKLQPVDVADLLKPTTLQL